MRKINAPCKDCRDRSHACHASCEKYLAFAKLHEEKRRQKLEKNLTDEYVSDCMKRREHRDTLQKKQKGSSLQ